MYDTYNVNVDNKTAHKRKGHSMRHYDVVKRHAIDFAAERKETVYITKSRKRNAYRILFKGEKTTPAFPIIEAVEPESEAAAEC